MVTPMPDASNRYQCPGCGYTYDESLGDDHEGYPPGFLFADLPDDFVCPDCAVRYKEDFHLALTP
jgi:rubredoxin|tara:strand:+ start:16390 stop:16584 length:195 start_codon:yes stop_codon:yes gene_type:complete